MWDLAGCWQRRWPNNCASPLVVHEVVSCQFMFLMSSGLNINSVYIVLSVVILILDLPRQLVILILDLLSCFPPQAARHKMTLLHRRRCVNTKQMYPHTRISKALRYQSTMSRYRRLYEMQIRFNLMFKATGNTWRLQGQGYLLFTKEVHGLADVRLPWLNGLSFRTHQSRATLMSIELGAGTNDNPKIRLVVRVSNCLWSVCC